MKKNIFFWLIILVILAGLAAFVYQFFPASQNKPELNAFAQCLTDKGWAMYGAYWCGHCQNEKRNFGSAFQYVTYVECPQETALCTAKGIRGYPTWLGPNGEREEGELGLAKLAALSGCELPQ